MDKPLDFKLGVVRSISFVAAALIALVTYLKCSGEDDGSGLRAAMRDDRSIIELIEASELAVVGTVEETIVYDNAIIPEDLSNFRRSVEMVESRFRLLGVLKGTTINKVIFVRHFRWKEGTFVSKAPRLFQGLPSQVSVDVDLEKASLDAQDSSKIYLVLVRSSKIADRFEPTTGQRLSEFSFRRIE